MIRFFFRLVATLLLAVAVIFAVLDATRTVAASHLVLTPLGASWQSASPTTLAAFQAAVERHSAFLWNPVATALLSVPGAVVFLVLALLFYAAGRRPVRRGLAVG
jgi:hypothetical protein